MKLSAHLICGSTSNLGNPECVEATIHVSGTGIHHTKIPDLVMAIPELLTQCMWVQCECSAMERESGHRSGCWFPEFGEALENVRKHMIHTIEGI